MCREKIIGAKMKTFFTHCFGRREIRKYFSTCHWDIIPNGISEK